MRRIAGLLLGVLLVISALPALGAPSAPARVPESPQWYWTHPLPSGNQVNDLIYAQGKYVAVGDHGLIMTAAKPDDWQAVNAGVNTDLSSITYGQGRFVAVGRNGVILTSANGETWSKAGCDGECYPNGTPDLHQVAFSADRFVAVGEYGVIVTSADGLTWRQPFHEQNMSLRGVTSDGSLWVAVGYDSWFMSKAVNQAVTFTSPDGIHWTRRNSGLSLTSPGAISYVNGQYLIGGSGGIATSTNGLTWQEQPLPTDGSGRPSRGGSAAYGSGRYVLAGSTATGPAVYTSTDGKSWSQEPGYSADTGGQVRFWQGRFFVAGAPLLSSGNGRLWWPAVPTHSLTREDLNAAAFGNGRFVVAGEKGTILTSPDGTCWSAQVVGKGPWNTIAFGNGITLVGGERGATATLGADGQWRTATSLAGSVSSIVFGNGRFVALGEGGTEDALYSSTDGITWTERWRQKSSWRVGGLYFANNQFVAVGQSRDYADPIWQLGLSTDGAKWTWRTLDTAKPSDNTHLIGVGGQLIAISYTVASSPTGADWKQRLSLDSATTDAAQVGEMIALLSVTGFRLLDPATWQVSAPVELPVVANALAYGNGRYVAAGWHGGIAVSAATPGTTGESRFTAGCRLFTHNGRPEPLSAYAVERNGEVMVPAPSLAAALGLTGGAFSWDASAKRVRFGNAEKAVTLVADAADMTVGSVHQPLTAPAFFGYGQLYVPVAPLVEALGYKATRDPQWHSVLITKGP